MKLYKVTRTEREDDYKHRYDDGVYDDIQLFTTKKKAVDYCVKEMYNYFKEILEENVAKDIEENYFPLKMVRTGEYSNELTEESCIRLKLDIKKFYANDKKTRLYKKLYDDFCVGEFVKIKFDLEISAIKVN